VAIQSFNSLAGFSVGESNTLVIDDNNNVIGNIGTFNTVNVANSITSNNITATGTVTANYIFSTGNITGSGIVTAGQSSVGNVFASGNVNAANVNTTGKVSTNSLSANVILGNLIPSVNNTYFLGNSTNRWANLWLGPGTIYITDTANTANTAELTVSNGILQVNGAAGLQSNLISGNSSLTIANSGNIALSVAGASNVAVFNSNGSNILGNTTVGNLTVTGNIISNPIYGGFWSNTTQTTANANVVQVFTLNNTNGHNNVTLGNGASNSRMIINDTGTYNLQFSVQINKTSTSLDSVYIWLRRNGQDIANTSCYFQVDRNTAMVQSWNYVVTTANVGDYVEIAFATTDTTISFPAIAEQSTPFVRPAIPSIITTIVPVGA
jgi:hypothetical protein